MLYRHVFDKISTEFRGILRVFVNFAALLLLEISEAPYLWAVSFTYYKLATKNLHVATTFLRLVAKRRPEDFFNFEPWGCLIPLRGEENEDNLFKWRHDIDVFVSEASEDGCAFNSKEKG